MHGTLYQDCERSLTQIVNERNGQVNETMESVVSEENHCCNIAITLIDRVVGVNEASQKEIATFVNRVLPLTLTAFTHICQPDPLQFL